MSIPMTHLEASVPKRILDPCCGSRMMWFDRQHPETIFGDRRSETLVVTDRSHGRMDGQRTLRIEPDVMLDFRELPYPDGTFKLVAFDPPHLERAGAGSWMAAKYGKLGPDWREDLRRGFAECFRVLDADGVLVFKWNETHIKVAEVLALAPIAPLFGQVSGRTMDRWTCEWGGMIADIEAPSRSKARYIAFKILKDTWGLRDLLAIKVRRSTIPYPITRLD